MIWDGRRCTSDENMKIIEQFSLNLTLFIFCNFATVIPEINEIDKLSYLNLSNKYTTEM